VFFANLAKWLNTNGQLARFECRLIGLGLIQLAAKHLVLAANFVANSQGFKSSVLRVLAVTSASLKCCGM
jgi:hypothetical protein